jgi:nucleoside-diphosphate-sugar epimerase
LATNLVTGGAGFFGEVLVRQLLDRGEEVRVLDLNAIAHRHPKLTMVQADIRDARAVREAARGSEIIYHNVAQQPLARDKRLFWSVNRDGTENVLKAALEAGAKRVVHTSSTAVFGVARENPVTEATKPAPVEEYGRAKHAAELLCEEYAARGLAVSIIRPRTILGHGRLGIFQILFEWIYQGLNVPVLGSGDHLLQFVHADDLAVACILAGNANATGTYNIGAAEFGTMRATLERLIRHAGTTSRVKSVPRRLAEVGILATGRLGLIPLGPYHALAYGKPMYFDISKARSELRFFPKFSQDATFAESYDWYRANRTDILSGRKTGSKHQSAVKQGLLRLVPHLI